MPQRIGVQAVVDTSQLQAGVNTYLSAINRMVAATQAASRGLSFGSATPGLTAATAGLNSLSGRLSGVSQQVVSLNSHVNGLSGSLNNAGAAGTALQAGIGAAIGTAAIQAIQALGAAVRALSADIVEQVGFWERLAISVKFFTGISFQQQNPDTSFAEALQQTQEEAQGTLFWLQKLSILSPFTAQQVGQIYRVSQAMGLTKEQADAAIQPLLDIGSAAGLSAEVLERVGIAMGQVEARGKLTGEEVRQFGNAGIPIRKILVEALGVANSEFDDLLESGSLLAGKVLPEVIKYMQQFEGAAEEVSKTTITGLLSSLQEVNQLGVAKFFTAATTEVREQLAQLVGVLTSPEVFAGLEIIGKDVGLAVSAAIDGIVAAVNNLVTAWVTLDPVIKQGLFVFAGGVVSLTLFAGAVGLLSVALGALINPFTLIIAAAAGFAAAWSTNWGGIATTVTTAVDATSGAISVLTDVLSDLVSNISDVANASLEIFADTLSAATEWGSGIVSAFADGILSTVSVVADALMVMGEMMTYWLEPGSPPRLLPDLSLWGTEAANVWLSSWTEADFGILDKITSDMKKVLQGAVVSGDLEEVDIPKIILGSQGAIADAIQQITTIGSVTQDVMDRIRKTTGQAADQVAGYLSRYSAVAAATGIAEQAQLAMNEAIARYDALLGPIEEKLKKIQAAQKKANDAGEIRRLERTLNERYASEAKKTMAQLRIDEIRTQQAIDGRDAIIDVEKKKLDAAKESERVAQAELDLFQKRIAAQTSQYDLLKQIDQIESRREKASSARAKAAKKELTPLEKQLKLLKLQQAEMSDMIEAYRARKVLADDEATAAQKLTATMKLQEISLNQQTRDVEALELGYTGVFDKIRQIQVVLADIEKPKKKKSDALSGLASDLGSASKDKIKAAFDEYKLAIDEFQKKWDLAKKSFGSTVDTIDSSLPSWLRLRDATGQVSPLMDTLAKAFAGVAAILVGSKLVNAVRAMVPIFAALGSVGTIAVAGLALVAAAWTQNWFDIQGATAKAVDAVMLKINELAESDTIFGVIIRGIQTFASDVRGLWNNLAIYSFAPSIFWSNFDLMLAHLKEFFNNVLDEIKAAIPKIRESFAKMFPDLSAAFEKFDFKIDTSSLQAAMESIGKVLDDLGPKISAAVILITTSIKAMGAAFANIVPIMNKFAGLFRTAFAAILSGSWQAAVQGAALAARGLGAALAGAFKVLATPATGKLLLGLSKGLVAGIGALGSLLRTSLAQTLASVFAGIGGNNLLNPKTFIGSIISSRFKQGLLAGFKSVFDFLPDLLKGPLAALDRSLTSFLLRINSWRDLVGAAFKAPIEAIKLLATVARTVLGVFGTFLVNLGGNAIVKFSAPLVKAFTLVEQAFQRLAPAARTIFTMLTNLGAALTRAGGFALRFATDFRGALGSLKVGNVFGSIVKGVTAATRALGTLGAALRTSFSLKGVLAPIQSIIKIFGSLGSIIAKGVGGGGGAIGGILQTFMKGFGALRGVIIGIGPAIKGLLAPTNIIGFTIGFIIDQIVKNWASISGFFGDLGGFLTELGGLFNPALLGNFMSALQGLFSGTEEGKKKFQAFFDSIWNYLTNWTGRVSKWFTSKVLPAFVGWAVTLPYEIGGYIVETFKAIVDLLIKGADLIRVHVFPWIAAFTGWAVEAWPVLAGYLGQLWNDFAAWIAETAGFLWTALTTEWIPAFTGWLVEVWPGFSAGLGNLLVGIASWIASTASWIFNQLVTEWIPAFVGWLVEVWPGFSAGLMNLVASIGSWLLSTAGWLANQFVTVWGPAMWKWIVDTIPPLLAQLVAWTGQLLVWLGTQGLPLLIVKMLEFATALVDWVGQAIAFILPKLGQFMGTILAWIVTDGIPGLLKGVAGLALVLWGWISGNSKVNAGDSAWGKVGEAFQKFIGKIGEVITQDVLPALAGYAGELVTTFIDGVMQIFSPDNLSAFKDAALGLGADIMGGIGQGIQDGIANVNNVFNNALSDLIGGGQDEIEAKSPSKRTAREIGEPIAQGINEGINNVRLDALATSISKQLIKALASVQQATANTMSAAAAQALPIAQQFAINLQTVFDTMVTTISNRLWLWSQGVQVIYLEMAKNVEETLINSNANQMATWTNIHLTATSWATAMKDAVSTTFRIMSETIDSIVSEIPGIVWKHLGDEPGGVLYLLAEDFVPKGEDIGQEFAEGIYAGIEDEIPGIVRIVEDMIGQALSAARAAMDAQSPSRETARQVGAPFVQGIGVGIATEGQDVLDQVADLIGSMLDVNAYNSGASVGQRVIDGLRDSTASIAQVANDLVDDALSSRAFLVGQTIGQQIAAGIVSSTSVISGAVSSAVSGSMGSSLQMATANLSSAPAMSGVGTVNNYYNNRNYNLTLNTSRDVSSLRNEFTAMEVLAL